jgi:geranylgeranyl pyrophosphate synthase
MYLETLNFLESLSCGLPVDFLSNHFDRQPLEWSIPLQIANAYLGDVSPEFIPPIVGSFACFHLGVGMADDILDHDPRLEFTVEHATNYSHLLIGLAEKALLEGDAISSSTQKINLVKTLLHIKGQVFCGQDLDLLGCHSEAGYWKVVQLKSASFFSLPFIFSSICLELPDSEKELLKRLGECYGCLIQLFDDLEDCMRKPCSPDWYGEIRSLPILFATTVAHPERETFINLRNQIDTPGNLEKAQEILLRQHAIGFCVFKISEKLEEGHALIKQLSCPNRLKITALLTRFENALADLFSLVNE